MFICEVWLFFGSFLNSADLICRSMDVSKCSEGLFDFEITRVDCIESEEQSKYQSVYL